MTPDDIRFTTHPSGGDVMWNAADFMRRSAAGLVVGTFASVTSAVSIVFFGDTVGSVVILLFGLSMLTGVFVVPFVWWSIRQRRDLVLAPIEVEANQQALSMTARQGSSRQDWSVFRQARETSRAFLLNTGAGAAVLLTKRGLDPAETDAFRQLLASVGLLRPASRFERLRPLIWVAVGLAISAILMLGPRFVAGVGATATMDFQTTIEARSATVRGTTDLPDGAIVALQLLHTDEWEREAADGTAPDPESSPWVLNQQVVIRDGRFTATFQIDKWPKGRAEAGSYFWVDASQPSVVIDRFGITGLRLRGPDVTDLDDRGPTLQVLHTFEIKD